MEKSEKKKKQFGKFFDIVDGEKSSKFIDLLKSNSQNF